MNTKYRLLIQIQIPIHSLSTPRRNPTSVDRLEPGIRFILQCSVRHQVPVAVGSVSVTRQGGMCDRSPTDGSGIPSHCYPIPGVGTVRVGRTSVP